MIAFDRLIAPLKRRILLMIGRVVIHETIDNDGRLKMKVTALNGEVLGDVEGFQDYGFASRPNKGAEGILNSVMGESARAVIAATEDREARPKDLKGGEAAVYTKEDRASGGKHRLHFKQGREVHLTCSKFVITTGHTTFVMDGPGVTITTPPLDLVKTE